MNTEAMVLMIVVQLTVIVACAYFFWRVLTAPHRAEPDSFDENDDES